MKTSIGLAIYLLLSLASYADTITLRTDLWCPYACDPKSSKPGFMVEIAKEVFKKRGHFVDYGVMNWARAIADVKEGKFNGLIGCSKAEVDSFIIPKIPTGVLVNYYYVNKNDSWVYSGEKSLQGKKIGVINDYSYGDEIDKLVSKRNKSFVKVSGENPLLRLVQMVEGGRIDAFIENPLVLAYTLSNLKMNKDNFKVASSNIANDPDLYIAFSPKDPKSKIYSQMLDEGIEELRKDGKLKIILAKYGLSDWKK
ncbi:MAG: transporter substrate-binding domain-containing protein [Bdellovibrionales bacterium]|nr:transporter substrate-binding domain-containing protein [Bdellovibrionales bacterium]